MDILTSAKINKLKKNGGVGYSETQKGSLTFTMPAPYTEKAVIDLYGAMPIVKISDCVPTREEMSAAYAVADGETIPFPESESLGNVSVFGGGVIVVAYGNNDFGLSSGIWLNEEALMDEGSIVIPSTTITAIHTIDPKFLPTKAEIHLQGYGVNLYAAMFDPSNPTEFENQQLYDVFSNACASDKDIILCLGTEGQMLGYNDVRIYLTQITKAANGTYIGAGRVLLSVVSGETTWATVTIETRETKGLLWIAVHLDN